MSDDVNTKGVPTDPTPPNLWCYCAALGPHGHPWHEVASDSHRDDSNTKTVATRDGNGRFRRSPVTAARDLRCYELYTQGKTYREIAEELDIDVSMAHRGVKRVYRETFTDAADELRRNADVHLDEIEGHLWEIVEKERYVVSAGRVTDVEDESPRLTALAQLKQVNESRRKLYGVDSPTKVTVDGGVRYVLEGIDTTALT